MLRIPSAVWTEATGDRRATTAITVLLTLCEFTVGLRADNALPGARSDRPDADRPNIVLILSDDHRYDFMGFHPDAPTFLETPSLDRMAREGTHLANAFVTTSLCSPSRASILTGRFMHRHRVVDNQRPVPPGTRFFPQTLQTVGYRTAFFGKWHMGHEDDSPRPGFDHWAGFAGQGTYFDPTLNINGQQADFDGYNADVLTDLAVDWMQSAGAESEPFFLYLSYKSVHYPFLPAERNKGRYAAATVDRPETMANSEENYQTQSRWIRDRRYSIHGIDHMETGPYDKDPVPDFDAFYRQYCETVYGLDENIGRVLDQISVSGTEKETIVIYLGDNGFALGEHGFYDKRDAFEESIRIPMLIWGPGRIPARQTLKQMIQNIDIAPTVLELAGVPTDSADAQDMDGRSFGSLLTQPDSPWREHILYEYHWEWNFPATPTLFALRTNRFKYIFYHGVWDHNGLYDLGTDPHERHNLINVPAFRERAEAMRHQLFNELESRNALILPVRRPAGERLDDRKLQR